MKIDTPPVDWFRVLEDLNRSGWSHYRISAAIGVPRVRVIGWKNQAHEPKYGDGERLLTLWAQVTGRPRLAPPTRRAILSAAAVCK